MSEVTAIDQTPVSLETINSNEANKADWNGREVTKESSNEQADIINLLVQESVQRLKDFKTDLEDAKENLKSKVILVDRRKVEYKKRKHEDDKAWGWNRKKTEKRLKKAEKNLELAEGELSQQKNIVENLQKEVELLESTQPPPHIKFEMQNKPIYWLLYDEIKQLDIAISVAEQDYKLKNDIAVLAYDKADQKKEEYEKASVFTSSRKKKVYKKYKKIAEVRRGECGDSYNHMKRLKEQKCEKLQKQAEAKNFEQGGNQLDQIRSEMASLKSEMASLKSKIEDPKASKES